MKNILFWFSAILICAFWPLSFIGTNGGDSWLYLLALAVLVINWLLYQKGFRFHFFLYLILPLIHPAFLFFPIITFLFYLKETPKSVLLVFSALLLLVSLLSWKTFYAYSIFTPDPLAFDTLNKKISLIPNRNLARLYHNKTDIFQDKFKANVFTSLDPNNYFFSLHPREIFENQNLNKFPYPALIPFLIGLYFLVKNPDKKWLISVFLAGIFSIALINNQDKFDLILYLPLSLICLSGLEKIFSKQQWFLVFSFSLLPFSIIELIRLFF